MNKGMKSKQTEGANGALDFLLARLQSEIDELDIRMEALFKDINELKEKGNG